MSGFLQELDKASRIARAAGKAAMRHYGHAAPNRKADASPVTRADYAANEVILQGLGEAFPEDAILSEESEDSRARSLSRRVWIIDPLDGTKEFLAQNGEFSTLIGLVVDGVPVLGAVYLPGTDVLYRASLGSGAWVERDGARRRLVCAPADLDRLRLIGSRSHPDPLLVTMQEALGIRDLVPCGSIGVKCARIAEGQCDLYIHPVSFLKEWDTCAPEVLLREAGGCVTDCLGGALQYNKPNPVQPDGILACAPGALELVMERIPPLFARARAGSTS